MDKREIIIKGSDHGPTMLQEIIDDRVVRERKATPNEILMYHAGFAHQLQFDPAPYHTGMGIND